MIRGGVGDPRLPADRPWAGLGPTATDIGLCIADRGRRSSPPHSAVAGHGFDDQGAKYDGDGNLRNWWTEQDLEEFKKRTDALVDQFSRFQVFDDLNVNGELTQGENIGDLAGLTIAYRAYKISLGGEEAPVLDGFTGDQRFFLGIGQVWKFKATDEATRNRVLTDPHSPPEFRVNGTLPNMPEFVAAFDVQESDGMYLPSEQRVKIW